MHAHDNTSASLEWEVWVDGVKYVNLHNISGDVSTAIWALEPGANMNQGPNATGMKIWWGQFKIWNAKPGW